MSDKPAGLTPEEMKKAREEFASVWDDPRERAACIYGFDARDALSASPAPDAEYEAVIGALMDHDHRQINRIVDLEAKLAAAEEAFAEIEGDTCWDEDIREWIPTRGSHKAREARKKIRGEK